MKLIEPSVTLMDEENPLIKVEKIGRICYKSNSDYTIDTAVKFIKSLIERGHVSVLEHAVFHFLGYYNELLQYEVDQNPFIQCYVLSESRAIYTTNLRVIAESESRVRFLMLVALLAKYPQLESAISTSLPRELYQGFDVIDDIELQQRIDLNGLFNHLFLTIQFVTDRGVTHEMVRHRLASYTQESTRYCNYSRDKFGSEIRCIRPTNFDEEWSMGEQTAYTKSLEYAEQAYMRLLKMGATPQQARGVLPTDLATTIVMTASYTEWEHFFDLRSRAKTGAPHPNMKKIASQAEEIYKDHLKAIVHK